MPEMACVFESDDEGLMAIAQSILAEAKIEFLVSSRYMQDMLAYGRMGYNQLARPRIMVSSTDAPVALELLRDVTTDSAEPKFTKIYAGRAVKAFRWFVILWLIISILMTLLILGEIIKAL